MYLPQLIVVESYINHKLVIFSKRNWKKNMMLYGCRLWTPILIYIIDNIVAIYYYIFIIYVHQYYAYQFVYFNVTYLNCKLHLKKLEVYHLTLDVLKHYSWYEFLINKLDYIVSVSIVAIDVFSVQYYKTGFIHVGI